MPELRDQRPEAAVQMAAALLAAPILVQPALVVASMLWARHRSILLHPDNAALNPPTVSRAIADPAIGDVFANLMLAGFALLLFCLWRIGRALYRPALSPGLKALWAAFLGCETVGAFGMVVLSQYTGSVSDELHLLGSYMLFFGHGSGLALCGVFIRFDRERRPAPGSEGEAPLPYRPRLHPGFSLAIAAGAVGFGILYFAWDTFERWDNYLMRVIFAMDELVLIASFELYLASFAAPLFRYERHRLLRRAPAPAKESIAPSFE